MMQVVICDDEPDIVSMLSDRLDIIIKHMVEYDCFKTTNPKEVIQLARRIDIDLLLIDIEMPEMNGFETVKQARTENEETLVIFVTNMDLYVYESLKYHPFRFIRKSHLDEIDEAVSSAVSLIKAKNEVINIRINSVRNIAVRIADIVYFESQHNEVILVTVNGEYTYRATLKSIEKELEGKGFVRTHSGCIVNVDYIHIIKKKDVEVRFLNSKKDIPISRERRSNLILEYNKSLR